ncbi:MAG TPA: hypothetical protein VHO48_00230 [Anaerolineaceae bacterium]|jgi:hypothetical protein|nr:hypothetical protein [Anaerolineaceae bacterium]
MGNFPRVRAIYTTNGEVGALLVYPYLYNFLGEWIGWVTPEREVYSVLGVYVGYLTDDPRIIRKRYADTKPRRAPIKPPAGFYPPATIPLAPMMPELSYDSIDVLMENPEELHTLDAGELKEDMD